MITIGFSTARGERQEGSGRAGDSLMEVAVRGAVAGIDAICGGSLSCATCHVYVDPRWLPVVGQPSAEEGVLLDFTEASRTDCSRLSCQVRLTEAMDGLEVTIPSSR